MTPVTKDLTAYIGTTFGPYVFIFNSTASALVGDITNVNVGGNIITVPAHGLVNNDQIRLTTAYRPPSPLQTGTYYYVLYQTVDTLRLSLTPSGPAIVITDVGSGVTSVWKRGIPIDLTGWTVRAWAGSVDPCDQSSDIDLAPTILTPATNGRVQIVVADTVTINWKYSDLVYSIILKNTAGQWLGPYVLGDLLIRNNPTTGGTFVPPPA